MAEPVLLIDVSDRVATIRSQPTRRPLTPSTPSCAVRSAGDRRPRRQPRSRGHDPHGHRTSVLRRARPGSAVAPRSSPGEVTDRAPNNSGRHVEYTMDRGPFPVRTKPLIGAINGAAITGGFELPELRLPRRLTAAIFADPHARVGDDARLTSLAVLDARRQRASAAIASVSLTGIFLDAPDPPHRSRQSPRPRRRARWPIDGFDAAARCRHRRQPTRRRASDARRHL
ncbi:MAG: hypothetical protein R2710_11005 [Acidimicrobiales bacterium]